MDRNTILTQLKIREYAQLILNGMPHNQDKDHKPVIKLFLPGTGCTWLLSELSYPDTNITFGLCDLGMGHPELGYADLDEIGSTTSILGLSVEKDKDFVGKYPISIYSEAAHICQAVTEDDTLLMKVYERKYNGYRPE